MTFPADLATLASLFVATNGIRTQTMQAIDAVQTAIPVQSVTGLNSYGGVVAIDDEVIYYGGISTLGTYPSLELCTRGFDGTAAAPHNTGSAVELRVVAAHHNLLAARIVSIEAALGLNITTDTSGAAVAFADLADRLTKALPLVLAFGSGTDWSFTHNRRRLVGLQCWRLNGSVHERYDPTTLTQNVNPLGFSTVVVQFTPAAQGYVVML
jgi:hypothetical protein